MNQILPTNTPPTLMMLTPELSASILAMNTRNRPVKKSHVTALAQAIKRGEWKVNGESIKISKTGVTLDGQHRCLAVIEAGVPVMTYVTAGLEDDVFETIDRGAGRTAGDILSIAGGVHNCNITAAIAKGVILYDKTGDPACSTSSYHPSPRQILDLVLADPAIREASSWASTAKWCKKYLTTSIVGVCDVLFKRKNRAAAIEFMSDLETGIGLGHDSPILLLRNRLMAMSSEKAKLPRRYVFALVFKAFKLHIKGASARQLKVATAGDKSEKDVFVL